MKWRTDKESLDDKATEYLYNMSRYPVSDSEYDADIIDAYTAGYLAAENRFKALIGAFTVAKTTLYLEGGTDLQLKEPEVRLPDFIRKGGSYYEEGESVVLALFNND